MTPRFTNPFGPLQLSADDSTRLGEIARVFVQDHLRSYERHLLLDHRRLDESRWKLAKRKDTVRVYAEIPLRERRKAGQASQEELEREYKSQLPREAAALGDSIANKASAAAAASLAELPVLLAVGSLAGTLDDAMYGVVNPTVASMRVKSSYVGSYTADGAVLLTLVEPSASDPFHSLTVKWMENAQPPVLKPLGVKNRDFVYLEVTGFAELSTGERVGYHLLHSVHFPQTPELEARVRGSMSVCAMYRQEKAQLVDVYVRAILNPGGSLVRPLVVKACADALLSSCHIVECAKLKKLAWLVTTARETFRRRRQQEEEAELTAYTNTAAIRSPSAESNATMTSGSSLTTQASMAIAPVATAVATKESCTSCQKRILHRAAGSGREGERELCKLCYRFVCSSCRVKRKLSFPTPQGDLLCRELRFCGHCLTEALAADALQIAGDEVRGGDHVADHCQSLEALSEDSSIRDDNNSLGRAAALVALPSAEQRCGGG